MLEEKINPNIFKLNKYFDSFNSKYFKEGKPISKYFEKIVCYNCGSNEISNEFTHKGFWHVRCKQCKMIYVNPRLKKSIYNEAVYDKFYDIKIIPAVDYRRNVLGLNKYQQISTYFSKPKRVLDIGCGIGEVLSIFKEHGWNCLGIEFNEHASKYAKEKFKLKVVNKSIYDFKETKQFEVILMYGVLEHLYDPIIVLKKVYKLLTKNGILVVEVPSADSLLVRSVECGLVKKVDRIIEGDRHVMLFSLQSFKEMLAKVGFKILDIKSNGLDISTINRNCLKNQIITKNTDFLQSVLDKNLEGDLLRCFFSK